MRLVAWGVHVYTALGLPLSLLAALALQRGEVKAFYLYLMLAVFVDATDGTMARRVRVKEVLPAFDGRKLDDIVDFLTFAFLPALAMVSFGLLPAGWEAAAAAPLLASGYGFCQERAKTDQSFVGFPSYWNIVILYMQLLEWSPWTNLVVLLVLSALVFVPLHYVYPTRTEWMRPLTVGFGYLWAALLVGLTLDFGAAWTKPAAWASLAYPLYYLLLSLAHHARLHRAHDLPA